MNTQRMAISMQQLDKTQAVEIYRSGLWKKWDHEQRVKCQLFQQRLCMPFKIFHQSLESVLKRHIQFTEFSNSADLIDEYINTHQLPSWKEIQLQISKSQSL